MGRGKQDQREKRQGRKEERAMSMASRERCLRGETANVKQTVGGDEEGAVNGAQRVRGTERTGVRCGEREDAMGHEGGGDGGPS